MSLALLTALLLAPALVAADEPYRHEATRTELPAKIGDYELGMPKELRLEEFVSFMVPYHSEKGQITLYFRKLEADFKGKNTDLLEQHFEAINEVATKGIYKEVKRFTPKGADKNWARGAFTAKTESGPIVSFVDSRIKAGHLVKIRLTTSPDEIESVEPTLKKFRELLDKETPAK